MIIQTNFSKDEDMFIFYFRQRKQHKEPKQRFVHARLTVRMYMLTKVGKQNLLVTNLDQTHPADDCDEDSHH